MSDWKQHYNELSAPNDHEGLGRRRFLQGLLGTGALAMAGTGFLAGAESVSALGPDERILVVVLMGGGNDGFSMVVPAEDGRYQSAREGLALSAAESIPLGAGTGLYWNSNLGGISNRYNAGQVAVVQGVGDPADDLSHFSSMARWMRGASDSAAFGFTGWLGRWLDGAGLGGLGGISVGNGGVPLHMRGNSRLVTALPSFGGLYGSDAPDFEQPAFDAFASIRNLQPGGPWTNAVASSMADAIATAASVEPIYAGLLPEDDLPRDLALAAQTINLDIGARILTVSFGDFDTHDDHGPRHQDLMAEFDLAVTEFFTRLNPAFADRVTLMTFSEFGRSWTANDAAGIDHGTASTTLVMGNAVRGGLYGEMPNFGSFDRNGDLESTVDFRSYYATILDGWLNADSAQVLGGTYENLRIFDTGLASCQGFPATHIGTDGPDTMRGTEGRDVFLAGSGDDVIYGLGGDDLICAGEGNDVIFGGEGNDRIIAAAGRDRARGGNGDDFFDGGPDIDKLYGDAGNDTIGGGGGSDRIWGGPGNDTVNAGSGADRVWGGDGDDTINGQGGKDFIYAGPGNDRVQGNHQSDLIYGEVGNDDLRGAGGKDKIFGGAGNDALFGGNNSDELDGGPGSNSLDGQRGRDTCTDDSIPGTYRC